MPIERVDYPNDPPIASTDWTKSIALIYAAFRYLQHPVPVVAGNIVKGAVFNIGGTVYQATADTAITGAASAYVKLTPAGGGATADAAYVANLAGVSWSDTYAGYYDVGGNLHVFDEALAIKAGALAAPFRKKIVERDENGHVGPIDSNSTIQADGVVTGGGGLVAGLGNQTLLGKQVDIGDWNMDANAVVAVPHGLGANWKKILYVCGRIRDDFDNIYYFFPCIDPTAGTVEIQSSCVSALNITIVRRAAGLFDSASFDSVAYNRGRIMIWYEP